MLKYRRAHNLPGVEPGSVTLSGVTSPGLASAAKAAARHRRRVSARQHARNVAWGKKWGAIVSGVARQIKERQ